jgi:hypothetical protein
MATFLQGLQRRENFLVRQITRGAEEHEGVGMRIGHLKSPLLKYLFAGYFLQVSAETVAHR